MPLQSGPRWRIFRAMARACRRSSAGFEREGSMSRMVRMPHMACSKRKIPDPLSRIGVVREFRCLGETLSGPRAIRAREPIDIAVGPQRGIGHITPGRTLSVVFTNRQGRKAKLARLDVDDEMVRLE